MAKRGLGPKTIIGVARPQWGVERLRFKLVLTRKIEPTGARVIARGGAGNDEGMR
jgi:hypothetical protein